MLNRLSFGPRPGDYARVRRLGVAVLVHAERAPVGGQPGADGDAGTQRGVRTGSRETQGDIDGFLAGIGTAEGRLDPRLAVIPRVGDGARVRPWDRAGGPVEGQAGILSPKWWGHVQSPRAMMKLSDITCRVVELFLVETGDYLTRFENGGKSLLNLCLRAT